MLIGCEDCLLGMCMRCTDGDDDWKPTSNQFPFYDEDDRRRNLDDPDPSGIFTYFFGRVDYRQTCQLKDCYFSDEYELEECHACWNYNIHPTVPTPLDNFIADEYLDYGEFTESFLDLFTGQCVRDCRDANVEG